MTNQADYNCHACGQPFEGEINNEYGTYIFQRCPNCGSAKTTLLE